MIDITKNPLAGRQRILIDYASKEIDGTNILEIVQQVLTDNSKNEEEIKWLHNYKLGIMEIFKRQKEVRPDINHKVAVNIISEISEFWSSVLLSKPVQHLVEESDKEYIADIKDLRGDMILNEKDDADFKIAEWQADVGLGYRLTLPNDKYGQPDEPMFKTHDEEPINHIVAFYNGTGKPPSLAMRKVIRRSETIVTAWTENFVFTITDSELTDTQENVVGTLPLEEYPLNKDRIGAWERVIPLQEIINIIASDGANGLTQHIQSLLAIFASNLTDEEKQNLKDSDGTNILLLPKEAQIKYLNESLDQSGTETLIHMFATFAYDVAGLPRKSGGRSTSDTGHAIMLREGWINTGSRVRKYMQAFSKSERRFLKTVQAIRRIKGVSNEDATPLKLISIKFTPLILGNLFQKAQLFDLLWKSSAIDFKDCLETAELFTDIEGVYRRGLAHQEKIRMKEKEIGNENGNGSGNTDPPSQIDDGSDNGNRESNQQQD